jgi:hypothetical protein
MNVEVNPSVAIEKAKCASGVSKSDQIENDILVSFEDEPSTLVADPLGLCSFGVKSSTRMGRLQSLTPKISSSSSPVDSGTNSEFDV